MAEEKRTIEVDTEFLESLYALVGKIPPGEKNINVDLLKDILLDIKRKIDQIQTVADENAASPMYGGKHKTQGNLSSEAEETNRNGKSIGMNGEKPQQN